MKKSIVIDALNIKLQPNNKQVKQTWEWKPISINADTSESNALAPRPKILKIKKHLKINSQVTGCDHPLAWPKYQAHKYETDGNPDTNANVNSNNTSSNNTTRNTPHEYQIRNRNLLSNNIYELNEHKQNPFSIYKKLTLQSVENRNLRKKISNKTVPEQTNLYTTASLSLNGWIIEKMKEKTNQDRILSLKNIWSVDNYSMFCICDGHGQNGHFIAELVSNVISNYYKNSTMYYIPRNTLNLKLKNLHDYITAETVYKKWSHNNHALITACVNSIQSQICASEFEIDFSGCTLCQVIWLKNKLISVNIGDSRAIMIKPNNKYTELTIDHKPDTIAERCRIEQSGGVIHKNSNNWGPNRVWVKGQQYPGIAMSRSWGDVIAKNLGVNYEPDIKEFNIDYENDLGVVIASDGVWEFISNETVSSIFNKCYSVRKMDMCVKEICDEARRQFLINNMNVDDISVIVVMFNKEATRLDK